MVFLGPRSTSSNSLIVSGIVSYFFLLAVCLAVIFRTLQQAYSALPIGQRTGSHSIERRKDVLVLVTLAVSSFIISVYHMVDAAVGSYHMWSHHKKHSIIGSLWSFSTWVSPHGNKLGFRLGEWLEEEGWLHWGVSRMFGSHRDFWWVQQMIMATAVWIIFVAIEGRRRNIRHIWAFLLLANMTSLSVAQNLFNIALLFTPLPMPEDSNLLELPAGIRSTSAMRKATKVAKQGESALKKFYHKVFPHVDSKPSTWTPHPSLFILPLVSLCACTAVLPYTVGTSSFAANLLIISIFSYAPIIASSQNLVPTRFGRIHRTIHSAHHSTQLVFLTACLASLALHLVSTYTAVSANTPLPTTNHLVHDYIWNKHHAKPLSLSVRVGLGFAKVLGALADHPLISKVGWDVLLSGASLIVWAGFRGVDARDMLRTFEISSFGSVGEVVAKAKKTVTFSPSTDQDSDGGAADRGRYAMRTKLQSPVEPSTPSRRGRPLRSSVTERAANGPATEVGSVRRTRKSMAEAALARTEHEDPHGEVDVVQGTETAALAWGLMVLGGLGMGAGSVLGAEAVAQ